MCAAEGLRRLQTIGGRIDFLGIPIDRLSLDETVEIIEGYIAQGGSHRIVLVNAGKIVKARRDPFLKRIIETADLIGPDGMWIVFASVLLGDPLPGRVNGTDLMERLLERADERGYRVFFLGARQEVVEKVVKVARERYPGLVVAGYRNGYFSDEEEASVVRMVHDAHPDILLVGLPSPQKEYFIARNLEALGVPICHGVGGSFDVMAGVVKRAPRWMHHTGLEFVYRWLQEPGRMTRRNLTEDPWFLALVAQEFIRRRIFGMMGRSRQERD